MSILIKGMEMPKTCRDCHLMPFCNITLDDICSRDWGTKRCDNCPLIPVPAHGRLIDADALNRKIYFEIPFKVFKNVGRVSDMILLVCEAPTIIEAEEGE